MADSRSQTRLVLLAVLSATALLFTSALQADYIFLKDGFVLQGRVLKEYEHITDPSGIQISISKLGGYYLVDDGVRRTFFPTSLVAGSEALDGMAQLEVFKFTHSHMSWMPGVSPLKPYSVVKDGDWQPGATRTLDVNSRSQQGTIQVDQVVHTLSPYAMEVKTRRYTNTYSSFLTREFLPEKILAILRLKIKTDAGRQAVSFDERLRVARFAAQAGWFEQSMAELNDIAKEHPSEISKLTSVRNDIKRSQLRLKIEEIEDAMTSGQHNYAQSQLAALELDSADTQDLTKLNNWRTRYKEQNAQLESLRKLLSQARQKAASSTLATRGSAILDEMERDVNLDNLKTLSVFLKLSEQEERLAAKNQPPITSPEQLLALALTGWMQGADAADQSKEATEKIIRGREFLLKFLLMDNDSERKQALADYLGKSPLKADEVVQIIDQLPPPRAETVSKPVLDLLTKTTTLWPSGVKYRVYLPPDYHHHRSYPLIILVPNFRETYESTTAHWLEPAARKGFVIAVPEWVDGQQDRYLSSDKEQEAVLEVLRDIRRRFRIDSNRVSLAGFSSGGSLVFDVALTRPHLFASAAVICGHAPDGIEQLRYNAQYLPFYVVDASKNPFREKLGPAKVDALQKLFEYWIPKGYPSLLVEYQGRGFESFPAEIPTIIDWMSRKKRAAALPELGKADLSGNRMGKEFRIVRPSAKRFYWMEVDDIKPQERAPVLVSAGWEKDVPNSLRCVMTGMKRVRVWLNTGMVNFENPVEIRIQGPPGSVWSSQFKKKLEPSLGVLLEDYYQRGDSKNLFVQYVDFTFTR